jgi:hypothetical protein
MRLRAAGQTVPASGMKRKRKKFKGPDKNSPHGHQFDHFRKVNRALAWVGDVGTQRSALTTTDLTSGKRKKKIGVVRGGPGGEDNFMTLENSKSRKKKKTV